MFCGITVNAQNGQGNSVFYGITVNAQNGQGFYAVFMQGDGVFCESKENAFFFCSFFGMDKAFIGFKEANSMHL